MVCPLVMVMLTIWPYCVASLSVAAIPHNESNSTSPRIPGMVLLSRQSSTATYTCDEDNPCSNNACCGKSGYCGYGPTYCGSTGSSPNSACWSNCDAKAECGQYAADPGQTCPLNVCCSEFGFCGTTTEFCSNGCQSNCDQPSSGSSDSNSQQRIMAYYEAWSDGKQCMGMNINQIPIQSLTHLNYAFGYVTPGTFEIGPMPGVDPSTFSAFTALKLLNPSAIISISLGGWSFNDNGTDTQPVFGNLVSSPSNRQTFVSNLMTFLDHYGFDGVDIDWEYPGAPDRQPNQVDSEADGANFNLLLRDIKAAFSTSQSRKYLSFTAPTSYWYLRWFDIANMVDAADYVNFMSYDLHGVWDATDPYIGAQVLAATNLTEIELALDLLWRNGVDPAKVNLGLAFYSRTFQLVDPDCNTPGCPFAGGGTAGGCTATSGILSYRELDEILTSDLEITPIYDQVAAVKYFTWNTNQWASFDDQDTMQQKIKYANSVGIGGVFTWAVDMDDANLDELRGMIYPQQLQASNYANDVDYWESLNPQTCFTAACGQSCPVGSIKMTDMSCPSGGKSKANLCCPIQSAPDPGSCTWRGGEGGGLVHLCNGQCHGGEVTLATSSDGSVHCTSGVQVYCCAIPEVAEGGGINCGWKDKCSSDQELMTFAGTFIEDIDYVLQFAGLVGEALAQALAPYNIKNYKEYCCSDEEIQNWKDCSWVGNTGDGLNSCDDNYCPPGIQVELTDSYFGGGGTCAPMFGRQLAWCCTPTSGQSLFLPVPLDYIFPNPPPSGDDSDVEFNLQVDDTWGTGLVESDASDNPNDASFGFVVITSPAEVQVSLDKRDGSPWEVFDCSHTESEEAQTVRMVCTNDENAASRCADIHKGYGAVGTIVEMPRGCGPGRYAVVKDMQVSLNQSLPHHLRGRSLTSSTRVFDLTFDYNFQRVPRDFGDSQMRLDVSNEEGYWDSVVNRPGQKKKKRSELIGFRQNRQQWLENEWRDAYHFGNIDRNELHKRWFGSDVLDWLANLVNLGTASVTNELHHTVNEQVSVILVDQQFGPCPLAGGEIAGLLKASLDANIQVDTTFGLTIIATLTFPPDLSNSYLYFKNSGKIIAKFNLDAVASWSYTSGNIPIIGLDNFPGATFRVPGIVTVGPNLQIFGSVNAVVQVAGNVQAEVTIASWEVEQVYPQTAQYPADALDQPSQAGTGILSNPSFDASISASGEVQLHLSPTVTFGIVFDSRWGVPDCSTNLVLDGYVIFYASAAASVQGDNSCPFMYGIDGGADMYARLNSPSVFGWGGQSQIPLGSLARRSLISNQCPASSTASKRATVETEVGFSRFGNAYGTTNISHQSDAVTPAWLAAQHVPAPHSRLATPSALISYPDHSTLYNSGLIQRDTFSVGPLITIPQSFLQCPSNGSIYNGSCPSCSSSSNSRRAIHARDGETCLLYPAPSDAGCGSSSLSKRANANKEITVPWDKENQIFISRYPSCPGTGNAGITNVLQWFFPSMAITGCDPVVVQGTTNNGMINNAIPQNMFATDHVFEVHFIGDFLAWLCGAPKINYPNLPNGLPFPPGWGGPSLDWCAYVFGNGPDGDNANPPQGFQFPAYPNDNTLASFISNAGEVIGGNSNPQWLAIYYKDANGIKGSITQGKISDLDFGVDGNDAKNIYTNYETLRKMAEISNVYSYLRNNQVFAAWSYPSSAIETMCVMFDNSFWGSAFANAAPGTPLTFPAAPAGVTNWGLRTLWCYWIDWNLAGIDVKVSNWWRGAFNVMNNIDDAWVATYMQNGAVASQTNMQFPKPFPGAQLPGSGITSTQSRYGMWGRNGNNYGRVF